MKISSTLGFIALLSLSPLHSEVAQAEPNCPGLTNAIESRNPTEVVKVLNHYPDCATQTNYWIVKAIATGDEALVQVFIEHKAAVNPTGAMPNGPLHVAVRVGQLGIVQLLLDAGADVNTRWGEQRPLHIASDLGHLEIAQALIARGADVNARAVASTSGNRPLHFAAAKNHLELMALLIDSGADLEAPNNHFGERPFGWAARHGAVPAMKFLFSQGANFASMDEDGFLAIHTAALGSQPESIRYLVSIGQDVNARAEGGETPLLVSARYSSPSGGNSDWTAAFRLLINLGADLYATNDYGTGIADWIFDPNNYELSRIAITEGGYASNRVDSKGMTLLHHFCKHVAHDSGSLFPGTLETLDLILASGAPLRTLDRKGWEAMHYCASMGNLKTVERFMQKGVDIHARTSEGETIGHLIARRDDYVPYLKSIILLGTDPLAVTNAGRTLLHYSAAGKTAPVMRYLLELGLSASARDQAGNTPLHVMAEYKGGYSGYADEAVQILQSAGADLNAQNSEGDTALHVALKMKENEGVESEALSSLVYRKANLNLRNNQGLTPLGIARQLEHLPSREIFVAFLTKHGAKD